MRRNSPDQLNGRDRWRRARISSWSWARVLSQFRTITGRSRRASRMPRPYPDSAKHENFCGGWDFQKAQVEDFHVISGYRSAKTNQILANKGGGVAKKSLHMRGMAIDIRVPGIQLTRLRTAAASLKIGGVGYYPKPDFIHIYVGRIRYW